MASAADGDLEQVLVYENADEIGELAGSFRKMVLELASQRREVVATNRDLVLHQAELEQQAEVLLTKSRKLESSLLAIEILSAEKDATLTQLEEANARLNVDRKQVEKVSEETVGALSRAAIADQEKSRILRAVIVAMEELGSCLDDAGTRSADNSASAELTELRVTQLTTQAQKLGEFASEIIEISQSVQSVASRTRLLSLNAKIEAAHAGKFGAGFHVVAGEVKELAERSAQDSTGITEVANALTTTVASLVEELRNVREVSGASRVNSLAVEETVNLQQSKLQQLMVDIGVTSASQVELF